MPEKATMAALSQDTLAQAGTTPEAETARLKATKPGFWEQAHAGLKTAALDAKQAMARPESGGQSEAAKMRTAFLQRGGLGTTETDGPAYSNQEDVVAKYNLEDLVNLYGG